MSVHVIWEIEHSFTAYGIEGTPSYLYIWCHLFAEFDQEDLLKL